MYTIKARLHEQNCLFIHASGGVLLFVIVCVRAKKYKGDEMKSWLRSMANCNRDMVVACESIIFHISISHPSGCLACV